MSDRSAPVPRLLVGKDLLVRARLRIVEIDVRGEGRLTRGETLRGAGVVRCGLGRGMERDGIER